MHYHKAKSYVELLTRTALEVPKLKLLQGKQQELLALKNPPLKVKNRFQALATAEAQESGWEQLSTTAAKEGLLKLTSSKDLEDPETVARRKLKQEAAHEARLQKRRWAQVHQKPVKLRLHPTEVRLRRKDLKGRLEFQKRCKENADPQLNKAWDSFISSALKLQREMQRRHVEFEVAAAQFPRQLLEVKIEGADLTENMPGLFPPEGSAHAESEPHWSDGNLEVSGDSCAQCSELYWSSGGSSAEELPWPIGTAARLGRHILEQKLASSSSCSSTGSSSVPCLCSSAASKPPLCSSSASEGRSELESCASASTEEEEWPELEACREFHEPPQSVTPMNSYGV